MINSVLKEYLNEFIVIYLDDILIYLDTLKEYKKHVYLVLEKLEKANLLVNAEKSKFYI